MDWINIFWILCVWCVALPAEIVDSTDVSQIGAISARATCNQQPSLPFFRLPLQLVYLVQSMKYFSAVAVKSLTALATWQAALDLIGPIYDTLVKSMIFDGECAFLRVECKRVEGGRKRQTPCVLNVQPTIHNFSQNNTYYMYVPRQPPQKEVKDEDLDAVGHVAV